MSQKVSLVYPIEALNINNPKFEELRKQDFSYFKAKSNSKFEINYKLVKMKLL